MLLYLATVFAYFAIPANSQNYPVFGTKRYHRSSGNAQIPVPASLVANPSYNYNTAPKYYYEQRAPNTVYHENYADDSNPLYYYPRQEYFGMPIYHGEYNPKPYYYAHPPSYSYYDDREIAANPLDDLHEEIIQEDERERQREMFPVAAGSGQNGWYDNVAQQDELTNNFLRNLIAYNRQIAEQQKEQQEQQQTEEAEQRQHQEYQNDRPAPIYDDDYVDYPTSDYEYIPENQQPESVHLQKYIEPPSQKEEFNEIEDENERQLKFLAHHQRSQPSQQTAQQSQAGQQSHNSHKNHNPPHWVQSLEMNAHQQNSHKSNFVDEEAAPEEYDDAWINWDRKRSAADATMKTFPQKDESIKAFSNRKPTLLMEKTLSSTITSNAAMHEVTTSTVKPDIFNGQKEIVLPRPANSLQRGPLSKGTQYSNAGQEVVHSAESRHPPPAGSNVYDTIKQLIAMQQKYQKNSPKLQKRFVSNEDDLVRELDNLKRRSV